MSVAVRTSTNRAQSGMTVEQLSQRQRIYERSLFWRHRVLVIARDDPELKVLDRILWDRIAKERFGNGGGE